MSLVKVALTTRDSLATPRHHPITHLSHPRHLQSHILVVHCSPPFGAPPVTTAIGAPGSYVGPTLHRVDPPDITGWSCPSVGPGLSPDGDIG